MLRNKYLFISLSFLVFYITSIVIGKYITLIDIALILYLYIDKDLNSDTLIKYVIVLGILNDLFYGYMFGTTSLILLTISLVRYIFIKNFSYFELPVVRLIYRITALIQYNILLKLFLEKNFITTSNFVIYEHIFADLIIISILLILTDRKSAIQNT